MRTPVPLISQPPRRCLLRELLDSCLPLDSDLDAFCSDHLPLSYRRFTSGLDRTQKITLLLEHAGPEAVEGALASVFPRLCETRTAAWERGEHHGPLAAGGALPDSLPPAAELHKPTPGRRAAWLRGLSGYAGLVLVAIWLTCLAASLHSPLAPPQGPSLPPAVEPTRSPKLPPDMRCLPGGTIRQKTETGESTVHVPPFCLDLYLVTARQYLDCFATGACRPAQGTNYHAPADRPTRQVLDRLCTAQHEPDDKQPMNCVSWHEARSYCEAQGKRLPSAAEWEIAAGALEAQRYPWGSAPPTEQTVNGCDARCVGWAAEWHKIWKRGEGTRVLLEPARRSPSDRLFAGDDGFATTSPIDAKPPSVPYGFYDLSGNLRQWTSDTVTSCSEPGCQPVYILKGGSWSDVDLAVFSRHSRSKSDPALRSEMHGFRCALVSPFADLSRAKPRSPSSTAATSADAHSPSHSAGRRLKST